MIYGCERETNELTTIQPKYTVKTILQNELETQHKIITSLTDWGLVKSKDNVDMTSRNIYDNNLGFTIQTNAVKMVENTLTGTHSYSFPIIRDSIITNNLENLILQSNHEQGYEAYIVEYGFSNNQLNNLSEDFLNNTTAKYTPINLENPILDNNVSNRYNDFGELVCVQIWTYSLERVENDEGNLNGDTPLWIWEWVWILESVECSWVYGGGGQNGTYSGENNDGDNTAGQYYGGGAAPTGGEIIGSPAGIVKNEDCNPFPDNDLNGDCIASPAENCLIDINSRVRNINNPLHINQLINYVNTNGCNAENNAFLNLAINAFLNGGDVDFEEQIITTFSEKTQCVYNRLVRSGLQNHNLIRDTFLYFGNNSFSGANLIYQEQSNLTNTNGEILLGSFHRIGNNYYITINSSQLNNRSPIEIAQTILHESVHALLRLHYNISQESFIELFSQYMMESTGSNNITHNIMRDNYVLAIANTLKQFDDSQEDFSFYESLAWEGLHDFLTQQEIDAFLLAQQTARNRGLDCN